MNPSKRISTILDYVRMNQADVGEICDLLDIVVDEFKASEQAQIKELARTRRSLKNVAKYLATQAG